MADIENNEIQSEFDSPIEEEIHNTAQTNEQVVNPLIEGIENQGPLTLEEKRELISKQLENDSRIAKELQNKDHRIDINLKLIYAGGILFVLIGWVTCVLVFMFRQLSPTDEKVYHVSDAVFISLLTSATANILALPAIILKYLFPKRHS